MDLHRRQASLETLISTGKTPSAGRLFGLPELPNGDIWVDIAGATLVLGVQTGTLSSWLSRRGPKSCPLPRPRRILYRNYWPKSTLETWRYEYYSDGYDCIVP